MSEPAKTPWKISVAAEVRAESPEKALAQIKQAIEICGYTYIGGAASPKREGSDG